LDESDVDADRGGEPNISINAVPEPGTFILIGMALIGIPVIGKLFR